MRWLLTVRDDRAYIVVLESTDWERTLEFEPLLSQIRFTDDAPDSVNLTARELDVLRLIVEGATNTAIAERLDISAHTVANHVASILRKLDAANRTQAAWNAASRGLLDSHEN